MNKPIEITEEKYFEIVLGNLEVPDGSYIATCNPDWIYYACVKVKGSDIVTNQWRNKDFAKNWLEKKLKT